jgi:hypothetical protein
VIELRGASQQVNHETTFALNQTLRLRSWFSRVLMVPTKESDMKLITIGRAAASLLLITSARADQYAEMSQFAQSYAATFQRASILKPPSKAAYKRTRASLQKLLAETQTWTAQKLMKFTTEYRSQNFPTTFPLLQCANLSW